MISRAGGYPSSLPIKKTCNAFFVPCDFSASAEEAFSFAVKLALQSKGELHVLHVLDSPFLQVFHPHVELFVGMIASTLDTGRADNCQAIWLTYVSTFFFIVFHL